MIDARHTRLLYFDPLYFRMRTVAIIGGGNSGLTCTKTCLEGGLLPTCYEMTTDIGGLWNYDSNAVDGKASVMKSTVINTSKEFMAFSDFPPPADYPNYMHNTKLLSYFRMYADKFRLKDYIRFGRRVTRIEPTDDYDQTGCWLVSTVDATQADSASKVDVTTERYDAVMLATGHHAHPRWVSFSGMDHFKGKRTTLRMQWGSIFIVQDENFTVGNTKLRKDSKIRLFS
jgi:dimethylaniline monooxygenase (N-oxide forming)